jgi:hypothetical protein
MTCNPGNKLLVCSNYKYNHTLSISMLGTTMEEKWESEWNRKMSGNRINGKKYG